MLDTCCESKSEESVCSDRSSYDEKKAIAFVTLVEEVSHSDDELVLNVIEEISHQICLSCVTLFLI